LLLVLAAEFVNGWTDAPNAIVTVVSTRVLSPFQAVIMATVLNVAGAMSGTAVAATIGTGIVKPEVINLTTVGAAMVGIILWSTLAWYYGLPTSESHALVAGLTGAGMATAGPSALLGAGFARPPGALDMIGQRAYKIRRVSAGCKRRVPIREAGDPSPWGESLTAG
jgi:PiT family inorganic phosphate transporter